jgi:hypothetical protein
MVRNPLFHVWLQVISRKKIRKYQCFIQVLFITILLSVIASTWTFFYKKWFTSFIFSMDLGTCISLLIPGLLGYKQWQMMNKNTRIQEYNYKGLLCFKLEKRRLRERVSVFQKHFISRVSHFYCHSNISGMVGLFF